MHPLYAVHHQRQHARLRVPAVVDAGAARRSDPRQASWGANITLRGRPPAILIFAPHKTGSTFFTSFLHDVAAHLGLCWYTDNAAFMYSPSDHTKCASPSCGHTGHQRRFESDDRGWGDCTAFTCEQLDVSAAAAQLTDSAMQRSPLSLSAANGFLWGTLRLPPAMRSAMAHVGTGPWQWYVVLHSRHPGDTLVSGYHSFGWTHPASPSASAMQRRAHESRQAAIRNRSVDDYVLSEAADLQRKYNVYFHLMRHPPTGVKLLRSRYEELVTAFPRWLATFVAALSPSYSKETLVATYRYLLRRHANAFSPDGRHKRSVRPGRFSEEVGAATIEALRQSHLKWWTELGYSLETGHGFLR